MDKDNQMIDALQDLIIEKAESMMGIGTSPEEIVALSDLVKAVNQIPRTLEAFDSKKLR